MCKILVCYIFLIAFLGANNFLIAQNLTLNDSIAPPLKGKVRHYERKIIIKGTPEEIFAFMDDINNTGMHMTKSNPQMMGNKLNLEWLTTHKTGLGTKYNWTGKVMGMKMKFIVLVTEWENGKFKTWGTTGKAKMIVISWFKMSLNLTPNKNLTTAVNLKIDYTKSKNVLGFFLGKAYSKWCVKSMLKDTKKHFEMNINEK